LLLWINKWGLGGIDTTTLWSYGGAALYEEYDNSYLKKKKKKTEAPHLSSDV
jgi:hypothetical protein